MNFDHRQNNNTRYNQDTVLDVEVIETIYIAPTLHSPAYNY